MHEKSHPRLDDFFVDVVTISVVRTGVWSNKICPKTYSGEPSLWFALFLCHRFTAFFGLSQLMKKYQPIAAFRGGNKLV